MSIDHIAFNRITFALPVQPFKVTAFISTQERLPAVTEFVLRLLHTCGRVSLAAFRDYFAPGVRRYNVSFRLARHLLGVKH